MIHDTYGRAKRMIDAIEACVVLGHDGLRRKGSRIRYFIFKLDGRRYRWTLAFEKDGRVVIRQTEPEAELVLAFSARQVENLVRSRIR
jgi:hypothetical protein